MAISSFASSTAAPMMPEFRVDLSQLGALHGEPGHQQGQDETIATAMKDRETEPLPPRGRASKRGAIRGAGQPLKMTHGRDVASFASSGLDRSRCGTTARRGRPRLERERQIHIASPH